MKLKRCTGNTEAYLRPIGPLSQLWVILDTIREIYQDTSKVDEVNIAHMCQLNENTVCCLGQASLTVDRH